MRAFKGFNKDLTCRGYQYEEGKEFHTERAECCDTGFHACEYPLDCFGYYDPAHSVFHEVELSGEMDKSGDNTKVCAKDKVTRAMRRSANFENHKVYFREGMDDLEECLLLFPEVDHDDLFDALDFAMTMADGGNEIRVLKREDFRI